MAGATRLAEQTIAAEKARPESAKAAAAAARSSGGSGGGGRSSAANEAEREREAVVKLIEALQFEQSLIGLTDVEREKANQLRRAGAAATDEQRIQIEGLVEATYAQTEALARTEEQMESLKELSRDVLGGMFEDLRDGADAADVLANALNRVAENLVNAGLDSLIEGAFDSGATGTAGAGGILGGRIIPGILHSGGVAGVDGYGSGRSVPAAIFANARRYHNGGVVGGLNPGEVPAILQRGERVIPRGGAGGGLATVRLELSGDLDARIVSRAQGVALEVVRQTAPEIVRGSVRAVQEGVARSKHFLGRERV